MYSNIAIDGLTIEGTNGNNMLLQATSGVSVKKVSYTSLHPAGVNEMQEAIALCSLPSE